MALAERVLDVRRRRRRPRAAAGHRRAAPLRAGRRGCEPRGGGPRRARTRRAGLGRGGSGACDEQTLGIGRPAARRGSVGAPRAGVPPRRPSRAARQPRAVVAGHREPASSTSRAASGAAPGAGRRPGDRRIGLPPGGRRSRAARGPPVGYRRRVPHPTYDRSPWLLEPDISFLNHGSFGACPAPVLEAQRVWRERMEAEPVRFLGRELERAPRRGPPRGRARSSTPTPRASRSCPTRRRASRRSSRRCRFQPGDELLAGDHEYNATLNALRAAAERDGAVVRIVRVPFPIHDPSRGRRGVPPGRDAADAVRPRQPRDLADRPRAARSTRSSRELDRRGVDTLVDAAHAPGHGGGRPRRARRRVLDGQRPQVAVRAEGRRHAPRPRRPPGRRPPARDLARRQRRPAGPVALPPPVRLAGHRRPDSVPLAARRRSATSAASTTTAGRAHDGERGAGAAGRDVLCGGAGRDAAGARRDARLDGRRPAARARADARRRRAAAGGAVRRGPDRGRRSSPSRSRPRSRPGGPGAGARPHLGPALQPARGVRAPRREPRPAAARRRRRRARCSVASGEARAARRWPGRPRHRHPDPDVLADDVGRDAGGRRRRSPIVVTPGRSSSGRPAPRTAART